MNQGMTCDRTLERHPKPLTQGDKVDYPSDEDSDDEIDFELEIPPLEDLINEFEKDDAQLATIHKDISEWKDDA